MYAANLCGCGRVLWGVARCGEAVSGESVESTVRRLLPHRFHLLSCFGQRFRAEGGSDERAVTLLDNPGLFRFMKRILKMIVYVNILFAIFVVQEHKIK